MIKHHLSFCLNCLFNFIQKKVDLVFFIAVQTNKKKLFVMIALSVITEQHSNLACYTQRYVATFYSGHTNK